MPRTSSVARAVPEILNPSASESSKETSAERVERLTSRPGGATGVSAVRALRKATTRGLASLKNSRSAAATAISAAMSATRGRSASGSAALSAARVGTVRT